ncbi:MAG: DUF3035 domain-containing protein [Rhodospirillales bacterium]
MILAAHGLLRRPGRVAVLLAATVALAGCDSAKEVFGLNKSSPDEFAVVTRAPLVIPPEFGLRPPEPGAARPQDAPAAQAARNILVRNAGDAGRGVGSGGPAGLTTGESALLRQAGALNADPLVRREVDRETTAMVDADRDFMDRLMFWQKQPPPGSAVDPEAEMRRLRENAAVGAPVNQGETPVIERRKKALFEGIFN